MDNCRDNYIPIFYREIPFGIKLESIGPLITLLRSIEGFATNERNIARVIVT